MCMYEFFFWLIDWLLFYFFFFRITSQNKNRKKRTKNFRGIQIFNLIYTYEGFCESERLKKFFYLFISYNVLLVGWLVCWLICFFLCLFFLIHIFSFFLLFFISNPLPYFFSISDVLCMYMSVYIFI